MSVNLKQLHVPNSGPLGPRPSPTPVPTSLGSGSMWLGVFFRMVLLSSN